MKALNERSINKILFITLSNIGDVILTLPCFDLLRENFPNAKISIMTGPRAAELFKNNPFIDKLVVYDKKIPWQGKKALAQGLKKENFDLIVDFRNSMFGFFIGAKYKTSPFLKVPKFLHMKARHLYKVSDFCNSIGNGRDHSLLYISQEDKDYIQKILEENAIADSDKIVLIGCSARSHIKRYTKESFIKVCEALIDEPRVKIILVGDSSDFDIAESIKKEIKADIANSCGKTSLLQLAYLINRSSFLISCDSAIMHLASYLNKPVIAIFGPTDEAKYGPWSDNSVVVRKNLKCTPCQVALCKYNHECMNTLDPEIIIQAAKGLL